MAGTFSGYVHKLPSLVIDLDNTLIFSTELPTRQHEFECDVGRKKYFVHVRPGTYEFLEKISKYYEIFFFTVSRREYSESIIRHIAPYVKKENCLYRDSCLFAQGYAIKDLNKIDRPLKQVVLVDDSLGTALAFPVNTIGVEPWEGNNQDRVLIKELFPLLLSAAGETDVPLAIRNSVIDVKPQHLYFK
ncbi:NLI interacting factor-like phosphatase family protein [Trichomonas vaginalis G3]|uniref:Mitochondrial import inner membrane translocase subunit TIM50 n=1 Tax=Trichomonas vaginalis (strain ATCC PRA-98 / G3) TaxID=412133 RepID=A2DRH4_TRIV3|nr:phosphoprotein phosphatase protein [Trichomonas vaginalis G3]EAY16937.1 NLI interacting factor-like phosphatase family protein [Trichomonas vaginalis G3]KAI5509019.1 phosphoprotein phosphatase protein [Trichomonas vaginalis G3]|eukprot:XP_001329160.1 NLI interacting factor-like phosphatase family protein [Trichomonas vaginalis G3]